mgnify:FL=1
MNALSVHLVSTLFMTGLIVFVQVVHYPLMAKVGASSWVDYENEHTVRTGWVVIPPMCAELFSALWIFTYASTERTQGVAALGLVLLAVIWFSTAIFQAPAHRELSHGYDHKVHRRLVRSNWIRTFAWLARVPIAVALVFA